MIEPPAVKLPLLGLKYKLVLDVLIVARFPDVDDRNVIYLVALVEVSSVMVTLLAVPE